MLKKSSLREDGVEYECTSEVLVKAHLIFSREDLLAISHMILQRQKKIAERLSNLRKVVQHIAYNS